MILHIHNSCTLTFYLSTSFLHLLFPPPTLFFFLFPFLPLLFVSLPLSSASSLLHLLFPPPPLLSPFSFLPPLSTTSFLHLLFPLSTLFSLFPFLNFSFFPLPPLYSISCFLHLLFPLPSLSYPFSSPPLFFMCIFFNYSAIRSFSLHSICWPRK